MRLTNFFRDSDEEQEPTSIFDGTSTDFRIMICILVLLVVFSIAGYYADHVLTHG